MKYFDEAFEGAQTPEARAAAEKAEAERRAEFVGEGRKPWTKATFDEFAEQLRGKPGLSSVRFARDDSERKDFVHSLLQKAGIEVTSGVADVRLEGDEIFVVGKLVVSQNAWEASGHYDTWTIRPHFATTTSRNLYYTSFD
jgi:hypothetical protein